MDWGKGILLSIIAFIGIIMTMVIISVRMDGIELVRDNYYEAEIKYQEQIDRESSTLLLDREVLAFDSQSKAVILDLPLGAKGNLNLYRPSDVSLDQSLPVEIIESGKKTNIHRQPKTWILESSTHLDRKRNRILSREENYNLMIWTAFLLGFLGSFHCIGMCGPIALAVGNASNSGFIWNKILYNLGRSFTYALLGLLIGFIGFSMSLAGIQQGFSIAMGVVLVLLSLNYKKIRATASSIHFFRFGKMGQTKAILLPKARRKTCLFCYRLSQWASPMWYGLHGTHRSTWHAKPLFGSSLHVFLWNRYDPTLTVFNVLKPDNHSENPDEFSKKRSPIWESSWESFLFSEA